MINIILKDKASKDETGGDQENIVNLFVIITAKYVVPVEEIVVVENWFFA